MPPPNVVPPEVERAAEFLREKGFWLSELLTGGYLISPTYASRSREFSRDQMVSIARAAGFVPQEGGQDESGSSEAAGASGGGEP